MIERIGRASHALQQLARDTMPPNFSKGSSEIGTLSYRRPIHTLRIGTGQQLSRSGATAAGTTGAGKASRSMSAVCFRAAKTVRDFGPSFRSCFASTPPQGRRHLPMGEVLLDCSMGLGTSMAPPQPAASSTCSALLRKRGCKNFVGKAVRRYRTAPAAGG